MTARPIVYQHARPEYITVQAFAEHFRISPMQANRLCHRGSVKWLRIGHLMRIPVSELERFAKAAEQASSAEVWGEA